MAVHVVVSHPLPSISSLDSDAIVFIIVVAVVILIIWAYFESNKDQKLVAERIAISDHEAWLESMERRNRHEDEVRLNEQKKNEIDSLLKRREIQIAELAVLVEKSVQRWRDELGETATNVRSNPIMSCPHCPSKETVFVADSNAGLTLARCYACKSLWKF